MGLLESIRKAHFNGAHEANTSLSSPSPRSQPKPPSPAAARLFFTAGEPIRPSDSGTRAVVAAAVATAAAMEDYPEELRTPPISLVSVVGVPELHPTISSFLHSQQPPINTLALPDFSKVVVMAPMSARAAQSGPPPGVLKREWLAKHRTRIPAVVAAFFGDEQVYGDPAQWLQVCTDLENLKYGFYLCF